MEEAAGHCRGPGGTVTFTTVKCKWNRLCRLEAITEDIQQTCVVLRQVQMEAFHVVNMHLLRCIEQDLPLPQLSQTFFHRCCDGVLDGATRPHTWTSPDRNLNLTVERYRSLRDQDERFRPPQLDYASRSLAQIAASMRINCQNMVTVNFEKRLFQYMELQHGMDRDATRALLRSSFRRRQNDAFSVQEQSLRRWLRYNPSSAQIKRHLGHFIRLLHEMLTLIELSNAADPEADDLRLYSLLPVSTSYVASHMTLNASTLHDVCARIWLRHQDNLDLRNPLNVPSTRRAVASERFFQQHRDELLRRAFKVHKLETRSRIFDGQVTTNGYEASVLLTRPLSTVELARALLEHDHVTYDEAELILPVNYEPEQLIGIDPGMRNLCTSAASIWHEDQMDFLPETTIEQVRTVEYYHLGGIHKHRDWHTNLRRRFSWTYNDVIVNMPTFKTASFITYVSGLKYFWHHVNSLLAFCARHTFRKWRFFVFSKKKQAREKLARRIVPDPGPQVCVGYGNWSNRTGIKGHPMGPIKGFKRELEKRAKVISMDEFNTSKLCCRCHEPLQQASYRHVDGNGEIIAESCRSVLRCYNRTCQAGYWDRDVNAALNILHLLQQKIRGMPRPRAFARTRRE